MIPAPASANPGLWLGAQLEERWLGYRKQFRRCRSSLSEEPVHELRVASRRLMALLALLESALSERQLAQARRLLKRRAADLGELRDVQMHWQLLRGQEAAFPELERIRKHLQKKERRLSREARERMSRLNNRKLRKCIQTIEAKLARETATPRWQSGCLRRLQRAMTAAFAQAVSRRRRINPADARTVHRTRVAFKKFRYMVEAMSPVFTGLSRRQLRKLAFYQRRMGRIQDLEVLQDCLDRYVRKRPKEEGRFGPVRHHLQRARERAMERFLERADELLEFGGILTAGQRPAIVG